MKFRLHFAAIAPFLAAASLSAPAFAQGDLPPPPAPTTPPAATTPPPDTAPPVTPPVTPPASDPNATPPVVDSAPPADASVNAPPVVFTNDVNNNGQPIKDTPTNNTDPRAPQAKDSPTFIDGSSFFAQLGASPNMFSPGLVQSPDVTVDSFVLLLLRMHVAKSWQVRVRASFNYEFTDNVDSSTTRKHEPRFDDVIPSLWYTGLPKFAGIKTSVGLQVGLPTSPESQARTLYANPGIGVALGKEIDHVLGGSVDLGFSAAYSHPFYHYSTPGLENNPSYQSACYSAGDTTCGEQVSGTANTANSLALLGSISATWGRFSAQSFFLLRSGWTYSFKDIPGVDRIQDPTNFRQATFFGVALDYDVTTFMQGEIGYQLLRTSVLDGDGQTGNPFYSRYQDGMRVYLGFNILLEKLYTTLRGKPATVEDPSRKLITKQTAPTKPTPIFGNF